MTEENEIDSNHTFDEFSNRMLENVANRGLGETVERESLSRESFSRESFVSRTSWVPTLFIKM